LDEVNSEGMEKVVDSLREHPRAQKNVRGADPSRLRNLIGEQSNMFQENT